MKISKMTIADLDSIADKLETEYDDFWNYNIFKSELENENSKYIVATDDDNIVGFTGIWIAIDVAHITNIVVKKDCRKLGIGSLLLENLIELCKKINMAEVTLEVNEHNAAAINLYKKFGFEHIGTRKKYYNNIDSALIMTKILN